MSDELLIKQCSPTLAGIKTGSIFTYAFNSLEELTKDIKSVNKRLSSKGLKLILLRIINGKALLYVFRPGRLKEDLSDRLAASILVKYGYSNDDEALCISRLRQRLQDDNAFPHEIGLFLGYPPEDVYGFIENKAIGHKITGFWKVYGDVHKAKKKFAQYKKCTDVFHKRWSSGVSIERLTVAV